VNRRGAAWARAFTSTVRQEAQFRLRPVANCRHQKLQNKIKKTNIRMSRNKNWSDYQAKSQLISLLQKNYFQ